MKWIACILLFSLSLTLGGVQLLLTGGRSIAHARAVRIQKRITGDQSGLQWMQLSFKTFEALDVEEIGQGVIEFEINGMFYDAYRVEHADGTVSLLVKKDHLDSSIQLAWKQCKRFLAQKGTTVFYSVFNFYFPAAGSILITGFEQAADLLHFFAESYAYRFVASIHAPPWITP